MTFDERVVALAPFGFTPRQTRFLVTAALHSGYCLRRQYLAFAGVRYGKNVRDFLEALVRRQLAHRFRYQPNRGHVYHLHAKALYRALAQPDNRNRRQVSPAVIARKLMLLDAVLTVPDAEWYATEEDKVALFTRERGIPLADLPQRVYAPTHRRGPTTTRYFMHKLPVYLAPDRAVVHFVYLVNDDSGHGLAQFLHDHVRLFSALPAWSVVAVCPRGLHGLPACRTVFDRFAVTTWRPVTAEGLDDVRWFFATRQLVEGGDLRSLSVADLNRFRDARPRFASAQMEALYGAWLARGERAFDRGNGRAQEMPAPADQFLLRELPSTYSQFGSFPGVC
jgi:hypothetical protein